MNGFMWARNRLITIGNMYRHGNRFQKCIANSVIMALAYVLWKRNYSTQILLEELRLQYPDNNIDDDVVKKIDDVCKKYKCSPREFILYDFASKNDDEIKSYLLDAYKTALIMCVNNGEVTKRFNNKELAYDYLKKYYKRDGLYLKADIEDAAGKELLSEFVNKHPVFMEKVPNGSLGKGIQKIDFNDYEGLDGLYIKLKKEFPVFLEELIINDEYMAKFHPESVNIVRVVVFRTEKGKAEIQRAYLSLGQGDNDIANAGTGGLGCGIAVNIDKETGITNSYGFNESVGTFKEHPDSHETLKGIKIKKWDELVGLIGELSDLMPEVKYIGWDLALTEGGWVIVEGNASGGQMLYQIMDKQSVKEEFLSYYNRI